MVVILVIGKPQTGKSSLINSLAYYMTLDNDDVAHTTTSTAATAAIVGNGMIPTTMSTTCIKVKALDGNYVYFIDTPGVMTSLGNTFDSTQLTAIKEWLLSHSLTPDIIWITCKFMDTCNISEQQFIKSARCIFPTIPMSIILTHADLNFSALRTRLSHIDDAIHRWSQWLHIQSSIYKLTAGNNPRGYGLYEVSPPVLAVDNTYPHREHQQTLPNTDSWVKNLLITVMALSECKVTLIPLKSKQIPITHSASNNDDDDDRAKSRSKMKTVTLIATVSIVIVGFVATCVINHKRRR